MKSPTYYMTLPFRLEISGRADSNGYSASYPDIPNCSASGKTVQEAIENVNSIKKKWFEDAISADIDIPTPKTDVAQNFNAISKRKHKPAQPDEYAPIDAFFPDDKPIRVAVYIRPKLSTTDCAHRWICRSAFIRISSVAMPIGS